MSRWSPRSASGRALVVGAVGLLVALPFAAAGPWVAEYAMLDLRTALVSLLRPTTDLPGDTAVILMDHATEQVLGVPQGPAWRQYHPLLIEILKRAGARAIVWDAEFAAPSEWDGRLAAACRDAGNVVAGENTPGSTTPTLAASFRSLGSLTVGLARGRPRRVSVRAGEPLPLSAAVAALVSGRIPAPGDWWIDFRRPIESIPAFSYADVIRADADRVSDEARTPLSVFRDRVVLIGKDLPWEGDTYAYPNTLGRAYPGVYGQAYAVQTLLQGVRLARLGLPAELGFDLLVCALTAASLLPRRRSIRLPLLAAIPLLAFAATAVLLSAADLWVGYTAALAGAVGVLVSHWVLRRRYLVSQLRRALGFRPDLIESFRAASRRTGGAVRRTATVVCSDVRSYTRFVREHGPESVARVMTSYVAAMERIVTDHGGYVNKYVGDEIVAIFGFPLREDECERRGVQAALRMLERLESLQAEWSAAGDPPLGAIGIGVDSGPLTFAEVGGAAKVQFDIIGDPVNGASRLQALTKETGRSLHVSADCFRKVENASVASRFRTLGYLPVRGQGERQVLAPRSEEEDRAG